MKILVIIIITINIYSYSQDNLNIQPLLFNYNGNTNTILTEEGLDIDNPFIIGWQWGGHPRVAKALYTNMIQTQYRKEDFRNYTDLNLYEANNFDNRIYTVIGGEGARAKHYYSEHSKVERNYEGTPVNAQALIFKAALEVPSDEHFIPLNNDIDSAIWGFKYKHPNITNNTTTQNFNGSNIYRIKLEKGNGYDGQTVLKDVYPNNVLGKKSYSNSVGPYLLSINLRRLAGAEWKLFFLTSSNLSEI